MSTTAPMKQSSIQIVETNEDEDETKESDQYIKTEEKQTDSNTTTVKTPSTTTTSLATPTDLSAPFHLLPTKFSKDTHPAMRAYLKKWNIDQSSFTAKLRYLDAINFNDPSATHAFIVALFNSAPFRQIFTPYSSTTRRLEPLPSTTHITKVNFRATKTTAVDLHLFDRLWEEDGRIVYGTLEDGIPDLKQDPESSESEGSGAIKKCFEDVVDGITITDELRKMVLDRDSDNYEMYSSSERQELLFQLFTHLIVGGGLNQYENNVHPYLGVLKLLYKDLLSVRTNRNTNAVEIANLVYKIDNIVVQSSESDKSEVAQSIFGKKEKDKHHLCYLSIDPQKKHITIYYFAHTDAW